jgi:exosortase
MNSIEKEPDTKASRFSGFNVPTRSTAALTLKVMMVIAPIIALYYQDLSMVFNDAIINEATSYILIIPVIFGYLIYRKRKMLRAVVSDGTENPPKNTRYYSVLSGLMLFLLAIIVYWYGSYTFTPIEYHLFTLPIFTAGLTLILFNPQTLRQALFPIIFLIFLMPPPYEIFSYLGSVLSVLSSEASTAIVQLFRVPATLTGEYGTPTIIITRPDTTTMSFSVDIACSGLYSLIGFFVFAVFIAYIVRDKTWKKTAVFAIGFPLIYILNIIRITTIVFIGYQIGEQLALDVFHLFGGWVLIFIGTILLLVISEKLVKTDLFGSKNKKACPTCLSNNPDKTRNYCKSCGRITKNPLVSFLTNDFAKTAMIIAAVILLVWIQMPVFATTRSLTPVLVKSPDGEYGNTQLFPQINGYNLQFEYRDTAFEKISHQDYSLIFTYTPNDQNKTPVWIALEIAPTTSSLHRWEYCLVTWPETRGYQPKVIQLDLRDTQILDNPPIIARYFGFQYTSDNQTQVVLYWYETCIFPADNATEQKQVKLSVIAYSDTPQDVANVENQIFSVAQAIANYWQPIKTWAFVSVFISQNGLELAVTPAVLLVGTGTLYFLRLKRQERTKIYAYSKLGTKDQQLVDTIREIQERSNPTIDKIKETYQKKTGSQFTIEQLEQKLAELNRIGVLKSVLGNNRDEPIRTWNA